MADTLTERVKQQVPDAFEALYDFEFAECGCCFVVCPKCDCDSCKLDAFVETR